MSLTLVATAMIVIGVVGVVVPALPGLLLVWAGIGVWTLGRPDAVGPSDTLGWTVLAVATALLILGSIAKYLIPGRALQRAGVPSSTLLIAGLAAIAGFFLIPVVGLVVGFVAAVFAMEYHRSADVVAAREATWAALKAAGLSLLLELTTAFAMTGAWVIGLLRA